MGTAIRAMTQGTVLTPPYELYGGTYALEVDHGTFVARYGEIQRPTTRMRAGDTVTAGQVIGNVGKLNTYNKSMLPIELYPRTATGALTNRGNPPYQQRDDLFDPRLDSTPRGSKCLSQKDDARFRSASHGSDERSADLIDGTSWTRVGEVEAVAGAVEQEAPADEERKDDEGRVQRAAQGPSRSR